jgi:[ribosomal protein S5]-alanine N-acetyltransferase
MPAIPQLDAPLTDGAVALRDAAERDIPEILIAYQDDPLLHVSLGERRPPSGAELGLRSEHEPAERATGRKARLTILQAGADVCRGQVYLHDVDWDNRRAELSLWVVPQLRGRGLGGRALRLAATWALEACGLARVQAVVEPGNEPMIRAALSAGFAREAQLRHYMRRGRDRVDAVVLSLLADDLRG